MTCGVGPEVETEEELRARALLERNLGRDLCCVPPSTTKTVDYRSADGHVGVEVKRLTSEVFNELSNAFRNTGSLDSTKLSGRWSVLIDRPTLSTALASMPRFPEDNPAEIARQKVRGWKVVTKAEREAEWRDKHPGPKRNAPRLTRLPRDLEPHLAVLEQHGIAATRGLYPYGRPRELAEAIVTVAQYTGGALCERREPFTGENPGIDLMLSSGYVRTGQADTIAGRIDLWLRSDLSQNLRRSLANEPAGTERHAVLVFDAHTEPEYVTATEQQGSFCPTAELALPEEVDVLWFILGPAACRYSASDGWAMAETQL